MQIEDVAKELNQHLAANPHLVPAMIHSSENVLDKHCRTITKVKGHFPAPHTILGHLVQGFKAEWQEMGELEIKSKILKNFHQKVNFPIIPSQILGTYYADHYDEEKDMFTMPISEYIMKEEFNPQIQDDLADLSINGVYSAANADGNYGQSLDGIKQVCDNILADAAHPAFKIPVTALTDTNIVDQVTVFERKLPSKQKKKIKKIFMSENNAERYVLQYEEQFGQNKFQNDTLKTRLGKREIIALPELNDDLIFATPERNLIKMIDKIDNPPKVTSVQIQDYKVKVFMEFWLGYDFWINEMVYIANYIDAEYGLGSTVLNQKYYDFDGVTVA
ncbi:hypothetical protein [Tenacibaculum soleae]|uniref:hypothetical protein n=1 Tax=Tenacibaculum soleae TaxID=447689 RepID=UPI0026E45C2C|nr:hypothetical protein [Tenacibaculum soleae]MDO6813811.1 hypothetical protein [Tenacibaculum soleae]